MDPKLGMEEMTISVISAESPINPKIQSPIRANLLFLLVSPSLFRTRAKRM